MRNCLLLADSVRWLRIRLSDQAPPFRSATRRPEVGNGTPTGEFFGAVLTGKGFSTMSIDLFTVKNGKLASGYHVENWTTALQQINSQ